MTNLESKTTKALNQLETKSYPITIKYQINQEIGEIFEKSKYYFKTLIKPENIR